MRKQLVILLCICALVLPEFSVASDDDDEYYDDKDYYEDEYEEDGEATPDELPDEFFTYDEEDDDTTPTVTLPPRDKDCKDKNQGNIQINTDTSNTNINRVHLPAGGFGGFGNTPCHIGQIGGDCIENLKGKGGAQGKIKFTLPCTEAYLQVWAASSKSNSAYIYLQHTNLPKTTTSDLVELGVGPGAIVPSSLLASWVKSGEIEVTYTFASDYYGVSLCFNYSTESPTYKPPACVNGGEYTVPYDFYKFVCTIKVEGCQKKSLIAVNLDTTLAANVYLNPEAGVSLVVNTGTDPTLPTVQDDVEAGKAYTYYVLVDTFTPVAGGKFVLNYAIEEIA